MKQLRRCAIIILCLTMIMIPVAVAESLSATLDSGVLKVNWSVDCGGVAVLTVYQNNWPISICNVNCADGGASVNIGNPSGKYSVRLKTNLGCMTASASAPEASKQTAAPEITAEPTATPEITVEPTVVPTEAPTVQPTQVPTATPTPVITPSPTPVVTPKPTSNSGSSQSSLAAEVVNLVNAERAKYGLSALRVDSELTRAACVRAQEIVKLFSHTRPDGTSWSTVSSSAHGETIAEGYSSASAVMTGWMNSQGHRENILRTSFGSIGVCAYNYNGRIYWVQLFGY